MSGRCCVSGTCSGAVVQLGRPRWTADEPGRWSEIGHAGPGPGRGPGRSPRGPAKHQGPSDTALTCNTDQQHTAQVWNRYGIHFTCTGTGFDSTRAPLQYTLDALALIVINDVLLLTEIDLPGFALSFLSADSQFWISGQGLILCLVRFTFAYEMEMENASISFNNITAITYFSRLVLMIALFFI